MPNLTPSRAKKFAEAGHRRGKVRRIVLYPKNAMVRDILRKKLHDLGYFTRYGPQTGKPGFWLKAQKSIYSTPPIHQRGLAEGEEGVQPSEDHHVQHDHEHLPHPAGAC